MHLLYFLASTEGYDKGKILSVESRIRDRTKITTYKPMSLVPGSISTIIALDESEEDEDKSEEPDSASSDIKTLMSPCFTDVLSSDGSSEYETDLEEEFPGTV